MSNSTEKLILSLDVGDIGEAFRLIDTLSPLIQIFKVGSTPYLNFGPLLLEKLISLNKKVFLDLKWHDIPNTVKGAVEAAVRQNIFMMNVHCLGGSRMLKAAVEGTKALRNSSKRSEPLLIGVTVLTSLEERDLREIGLSYSAGEEALRLARLAKEAALNGVVASAQEAAVLKEQLGEDFLVVTPGIRPKSSQVDDQRRVVTPSDALKMGSDYLVVGRPIIKAADPLQAAESILDEMERVRC